MIIIIAIIITIMSQNSSAYLIAIQNWQTSIHMSHDTET